VPQAGAGRLERGVDRDGGDAKKLGDLLHGLVLFVQVKDLGLAFCKRLLGLDFNHVGFFWVGGN